MHAHFTLLSGISELIRLHREGFWPTAIELSPSSVVLVLSDSPESQQDFVAQLEDLSKSPEFELGELIATLTTPMLGLHFDTPEEAQRFLSTAQRLVDGQ